MNLEQIDHIAFTCKNPEFSKDWYVGVLGFKHIYPGEWDGVPIFVQLGTTAIALFPEAHRSKMQPKSAKGLSHFALRARTQSDLKNAQVELKAKNIPFDFQDHQLAHSIYFNDPDGHRVEITTYDIEEKD